MPKRRPDPYYVLIRASALARGGDYRQAATILLEAAGVTLQSKCRHPFARHDDHYCCGCGAKIH